MPAEVVGEDDTHPGDLRHREVDENDAPLEHLHAERDVGGSDQQARDERGPQDAEARSVERHLTMASSRPMVSSNNPNRSFALSVPPTVKGIITAGMLALIERNSAACGLL